MCATSIGNWFKHVVTPDMINFPPKGFDVKVGALCLDDFRNAANYLAVHGYPISGMKEDMMQAMFMDT